MLLHKNVVPCSYCMYAMHTVSDVHDAPRKLRGALGSGICMVGVPNVIEKHLRALRIISSMH